LQAAGSSMLEVNNTLNHSANPHKDPGVF